MKHMILPPWALVWRTAVRRGAVCGALLGAAMAMFVLGDHARGGIQTTSSQATFYAQTNPQQRYVETFASTAYVLNDVYPSPIALSGAGFTASASVLPPSDGGDAGQFYFLGTESDKWLSTELARAIRFSFSGTLPTALGGMFFMTDFTGTPTGSLGPAMVLTVNGSTSFTLPAATNADTRFFGMYGDVPMSTLTIERDPSYAGSDRFVTINDFTMTAAVPEPCGLAWLGCGGVAVVGAFGQFAGRRQRVSRTT